MPEQTIPSTQMNKISLLKAKEDVSDRVREIQDSISRRAFEIFEANGRVLGRDLENWIQAESELLYPACLHISKSGNALTVRGELTGFKVGDIEVKVEPRRLTVVGKRATREGEAAEEPVTAERSGDRIFQVIDLPVQVDGERVTGILRNGVLELSLPLAAAANATPGGSMAA
jgi:HSP20 family molecular chaperone IbpA